MWNVGILIVLSREFLQCLFVLYDLIGNDDNITLSDGVYVWGDHGKVDFSQWGSASKAQAGQCLAVDGNGLHSVKCTDKLTFICQVGRPLSK